MNKIVNRQHEQQILENTIASNESEFIAIYGRRRIGKTYLISNFCRKKGVYFEVTGLNIQGRDDSDSNPGETDMSKQIRQFSKKIGECFYGGLEPVPPANWMEAFELLQKVIEEKKIRRKIILFLDEVPWLAGKRTDFLAGIDHFWNTWASRRKNIKLIICGSAASWIIKNIVNSKGGLHNRITRTIQLLPFSLREAKKYLAYRGIRYGHRDVADIYMVTGGVPFYLKQIEKGLSPAQNINRMCFVKDGLLVREFDNLFKSLFSNSDRYEAIVKALAAKRSGQTITEIAAATGIPLGGSLNDYLNNLLQAGFIIDFPPYKAGKKGAWYRLSDEYSLFYIKWIKPAPRSIMNDPNTTYWQQLETSRKWKSWAGYAFENICFKHISEIKKAIGIGAVFTTEGPWEYIPEKNTPKSGAQIDLVIDRSDNVISLCEMKYYKGKFKFTKKTTVDLKKKIAMFREITKTNKTIFVVMVTTDGITRSRHTEGVIDNIVTLKDFFD